MDTNADYVEIYDDEEAVDDMSVPQPTQRRRYKDDAYRCAQAVGLLLCCMQRKAFVSADGLPVYAVQCVHKSMLDCHGTLTS